MKKHHCLAMICLFALPILFLAPDAAWSYWAPVANAGGPYTVAKGSGVTLDASGSFDADFPNDYFRTVAWDLNNDGLFEFTSSGSDKDHPANLLLSLSAGDLTAMGWTNIGIAHRVSLRITDSYDLTSAVAETTLSITNASTPVPLPSALLLLGPGVAGLAALRRHLRKRKG